MNQTNIYVYINFESGNLVWCFLFVFFSLSFKYANRLEMENVEGTSCMHIQILKIPLVRVLLKSVLSALFAIIKGNTNVYAKSTRENLIIMEMFVPANGPLDYLYFLTLFSFNLRCISHLFDNSFETQMKTESVRKQ